MRRSEQPAPPHQVEQSEEEANLVERCKVGDERAWQDFFQRYDIIIKDAIRNALPPFIGQDRQQVLEDIVQNVRIGITRSLKDINTDQENNLSGWVAQIARRRAVDWIRSELMVGHNSANQRWIPSTSSLDDVPIKSLADTRTATPEAEAMGRQFRELFAQAVENLSERTRAMWKKYYIDGKMMAEIGKEIGITTGQVSRIISGANEAIKEELKDFLNHN